MYMGVIGVIIIKMGSSCCGISGPLQGEQDNSLRKDKRYFRKTSYSKPVSVTKGVNVKRNPITGLYEGFPKEWVENNQIDITVDISKVVTTSHLSTSIRPDPILPSSILNRIELTDQKPPRQQKYQMFPQQTQAGDRELRNITNSCVSRSKREY